MGSERESEVVVRLRRLRPEDGDLSAPRYMSADAAGMDLAAAVSAPHTVLPGERFLVPTGFAVEIPRGFEGQVRPRSGLAMKHGVTVANAPGTIDADYRVEVSVLLVNLGAEPWTVERGTRVAQLVIAPVVQARLELVDELGATTRGANGFGSSGSN
jgi:dUTP pyrophosphatase